MPNLSQIRRPSKSAIVNSSIAHIHASRRHRMVAARELRMLKVETDALRRELNEWRDRSGLPRLEEPTRNDGFNLVLSGEVEVIVPSAQHDDEENMEDDGDDDLYHARSSEDVEEVARATAINMVKPSQSPTSTSSPTSHQFAHNVPPLPVHQNGVAHAHSQQVPGGPQPHPAIAQLLHGQHPHSVPSHHISNGSSIIAGHQPPVSYENSAMIYDGYHSSQFGYNVPQSYNNGQLPPHILAQLAAEIEHKVTPGWYNSTGQFTPPSSSGGPSPVGSPFGGINGGLPNYPITQHRYAEDGVIGRERSASIGGRGSPVGSYELVNGTHMETVPRWRDEGMVGAPGPNQAAYSLLM